MCLPAAAAAAVADAAAVAFMAAEVAAAVAFMAAGVAVAVGFMAAAGRFAAEAAGVLSLIPPRCRAPRPDLRTDHPAAVDPAAQTDHPSATCRHPVVDPVPLAADARAISPIVLEVDPAVFDLVAVGGRGVVTLAAGRVPAVGPLRVSSKTFSTWAVPVAAVSRAAADPACDQTAD
jgi:hypothetical protein